MDIEIVRNHYPVGQGFFSSQQISYGNEKYTCVYDCGSVSKGGSRLLDKYVDYLRDTTEAIDLLVISHFDNDHINGVKKLVGKFNINKIVIPYLSTFEKLLLLLGKNIPLNLRAMQNDLYFLAYLVDSIDSEDSEDNNFLRRIEEGRIEVISSRSEVTSVPIHLDGELPAQIDGRYRRFWEFSYFSLAPGEAGKVEGDLIEKFEDNLTEELLQGIENNDISFIYENRSRIKCAYRKAVCEVSNNYSRKVPKTDPYNFSSVILYSGPHKDNYLYRSYGPYCYHGPYDYIAPARRTSSSIGWLGTGDARLKQHKNIDELERKLSWRKDHIHTITVPHHGSDNNWHSRFIELFGKDGSGVYCIAAADPKCRRYKRPHPHDSVVGDIVCHHSSFYLVSTEPSSFYKEKIKIHLRY